MTAIPNYRSSGFTLIEVIVVLAIMGLLTALVASQGRPKADGLRARIATSELASSLRRARALAITSNRAVGVTLDLDKMRYQIGSSHPVEFPDHLEISLTTASEEVQSGVAERIMFEPDGSSTGGQITIRSRGLTTILKVDWLSGRVSEVKVS